MREKLKEARKCAERAIGLRLPDAAAKDVLVYAWRKLKVVGKSSDYLPLLYKSELLDFARRLAISANGGASLV